MIIQFFYAFDISTIIILKAARKFISSSVKFHMLHMMRVKKIILLMKTIHYPNKMRSHLVTIVPMASFTSKSTLKLRSALHFRYSIVIPRFISSAYAVES